MMRLLPWTAVQRFDFFQPVSTSHQVVLPHLMESVFLAENLSKLLLFKEILLSQA